MLDFKDMKPIDEVEPLPEVKVPEGTPMGDLACFFNESQGNGLPGCADIKPLPHEMVALAEKYGEEKRSVKVAENKLLVRKQELAEQETALFDTLVGLEVESFSSKGWTYFTRVDSYASVDASQTEAAHSWIKGEGFGGIIKLTVNAKSLTSVLKEVFEVTGAVPGEDDGIKVRTVNRVGVRKK